MEDAFFKEVVGEKLTGHCKGLVGAGAVIVAGGCLRIGRLGLGWSELSHMWADFARGMGMEVRANAS